MHRWFRTGLLSLALAWPANSLTAADAVQFIRPDGEFAQLLLNIDMPEEARESVVHRGHDFQARQLYPVRDGVVTIDNGIGLLEPGGTLRIEGGRLHGSYFAAPLQETVSIEGKITGGRVDATATIGGKRYPVSGEFRTAEHLERTNAISDKQAWPLYAGPAGGGLSMPASDVTLLDNPRNMRPVWRAEALDIGTNVGEISRFMKYSAESAAGIRTASGGASPILADGKVFFSYYRPSPAEREGQLDRFTPAESIERYKKDAVKAGLDPDHLPNYALEKSYLAADEIVVALDAETGSVVWKWVYPDRGVNFQNHKGGPFNMTPAYSDGRVFALHTSYHLTAHDAATGEWLWAQKLSTGHKALISNAMLAFKGVVIAPHGPGWSGFDAETGELLWQSLSGAEVSSFSPWVHDGTPYAIGYDPDHRDEKPNRVVCLNARTGEIAWELPINIMTAGRGLGSGGLTISGDILLAGRDKGTGKRGEPIIPSLEAYMLSPDKPQPLWQIGADEEKKAAAPTPKKGGNYDLYVNWSPVHGESNPVVVQGKWVYTADGRVAELGTGKVVYRNPEADPPRPMNGGYMQAFGEYVLVRRDGTHGGISCFFYHIDANGQAELITDYNEEKNRFREWHPWIGGGSTSYHHPVYYPIIDGRIFLRQRYGIYCWDMREPQSD